ncbi:MAG: CAP domain-containing protein [Thermoleophilia bacterium]|nr:CAP domain-containing protein [Thermoleophilia bacterium]MDQ3858310.1 CAP domain-containing protein [Actinomycetota bacterium]
MRRGLVATAAILSLLASLAPPAASATRATGIERGILHTVNEARAARSLPPVRFASPLQRSAHRYAARLLRTDAFDHAAIGPGTRENLAWATTGAVRPRRIVRMWLTSPAHCRTLVWRAARRAGVGAVRGPYRGYSDAIVVVLRVRSAR